MEQDRFNSFCKSSFEKKDDCLAILPLKNCKVEGLKKIYGTFFVSTAGEVCEKIMLQSQKLEMGEKRDK